MVALTSSRMLLISLLLSGCASPVKTQVFGAPGQVHVKRIALAPFEGDPEAAALVTAHVLRALNLKTSFEVVPPEEVHRLVSAGVLSRRPRVPVALGPLLRQAFGADAVLYGKVSRFDARVGSTSGAARPAAVRFEVWLRSVDGVPLWQGSYAETQRSLSEDVGSIQRAARRGFRWVSAEALSTYGAEQLVTRLAEQAAAWR